jgi:hypothetical protein
MNAPLRYWWIPTRPATEPRRRSQLLCYDTLVMTLHITLFKTLFFPHFLPGVILPRWACLNQLLILPCKNKMNRNRIIPVCCCVLLVIGASSGQEGKKTLENQSGGTEGTFGQRDCNSECPSRPFTYSYVNNVSLSFDPVSFMHNLELRPIFGLRQHISYPYNFKIWQTWKLMC